MGRAAEKLEDATFEMQLVATVVEATSQPMPRRDPLRPLMDIIYREARTPGSPPWLEEQLLLCSVLEAIQHSTLWHNRCALLRTSSTARRACLTDAQAASTLRRL